jgi:RimJ/RimL family protein N-acetyltransferase
MSAPAHTEAMLDARQPATRPAADVRWPIVTDEITATARPLERRDRGALRRAFETLSEESRYRRFLSPKTTLTERELDYLVDVDGRDHFAILVELPGSREPIAVARFVRARPDADLAELAIAVADEWQGRGIGGRLLELLIGRARSVGIQRLVALTLAGNGRMIAALRRHGFVSVLRSGETVELELRLAAVGWSQDRNVATAVGHDNDLKGTCSHVEGLARHRQRPRPRP